MIPKQKLNVDAPRAITDFEAVAKEFELSEKLYRIIFRGKGLEFDKYREYSPDEDASNIDWKASLRSNKLMAKQYIEERELNIIFAVDVSENMLLGSYEKLKCEYAVELFAAMAHLMVVNNDRIGLILYSNEVKNYFPPKGGSNNFFFLLDILSDPAVYGGPSNTSQIFNFLLDYLDESIDSVILISDFIKLNEKMTNDLFLISKKFETMGVMVKDLLDKTFPDIDREIVVEDPETGEQILINPKIIKKLYEKNALESENKVKNIFKNGDVDLLELMTDRPFAYDLVDFLKERVKRRNFFM